VLSGKQLEYLAGCDHRWNLKTGATGSGKSWLDYAVVIPKRIMALKGEGAAIILGNTQGTANRNILEPMRDIWGQTLVGPLRAADNSARLFGRKVYVMGADSKKHVARIQGMTIEYAYGDEMTTWAQEVFEMLKSRLRCPHSGFDGTCNPDNPEHWLKKFIDSDADVFNQTSTIDDNPFLPPDFVENLKREYAGSVYYDRFILGHWVAAEGAIYRLFADDPERFQAEPEDGDIHTVWIGQDFGGNGSAHAMVALGTDARFTRLWALDEYYRKGVLTPQELERDFCEFVQRISDKYRLGGIYADSAEQVLIQGERQALYRSRLLYDIENSLKKPIVDRIRFTVRMLGAGRLFISPRCAHLIEALRSARWDEKHTTEDVRLDDGTTNIDSLDALEYAFERYMEDYIR
jgi:PBSX family phage terminase large subunit